MNETYRGIVHSWQCDFLGHMNVQFYVSKFDEASWHLIAKYGLTPEYFKTSQRSVAIVEQRIKYFRELNAGDLLVIRSKIVKAKTKSLHIFQRMINSQTNTIVAEEEIICVQIDTNTRKFRSFPNEIFKKLVAAVSDTKE